MNFFKKITFLFLFLFINKLGSVTNLSFNVKTPSEHEKIKCLSLILKNKTNDDEILTKLGKTLKYDLEFTDQMEINLKKSKKRLTKELEEKFFNNDVSLCLYISNIEKNKTKIELKNLGSGSIEFEKEFKINTKNLIQSAHRISDELLPKLTGEESMCKYCLAYCKMISNTQKNIVLSDYSCNFEKTLISEKLINVAPSWHTKTSTIFYSQFTKNKINLMSYNLKNNKNSIICSYDGLNMQPSFSNDGSKAALCMSGGKNSEIYLFDSKISKKLKQRVFKKLTNNGGNNVSPYLLENDDVIFCSDFQTGQPQIYYLNRKENYTYRLTNGKGYCAAPSYCAKNNNVVYTRPVNGTFQLFTLNLDNFDNLQEKQITFNGGNKHEPDYSPCGRFIVFSYDFEYKKGYQTQQIAVLNVNSGKIRVLTQSKAPKSFPKWSKTPIIT
ncbi:hypothetical protein GF385_00720 [Candidatus Dependentiae bacterium]|nr:hypothetical protein [Candidatus Dependentiae bacterium]